MQLTHAPRRDPLAEALSRPIFGTIAISGELIAYAAIILVGTVLRFWDLGPRMLHHDESLHAVYSWYLYVGRGYAHDPMMHGPFMYHLMALMYWLFGASDATARYGHALWGSLLLLAPYFMRHWIGRTGALVATALLAVSPSMLYFSRFAREDIIIEPFIVALTIFAFKYLESMQRRYLYLAAAALSLAFCEKESTYLHLPILVVYLFGLQVYLSRLETLDVFKGRFDLGPAGDLVVLLTTVSLPLWASAPLAVPPFKHLDPATADQVVTVTGVAFTAIALFIGLRWNRAVWTVAAAIFWGIFTLLYTTLFSNPGGFVSGLVSSLRYWIEQQDVARGGQPTHYYLIMLPLYEFVPVLFGLAGAFYWLTRRNRIAHYCVLWFVGALGAYTIASEKMPWLLIHIAMPLIILAGMTIGRLVDAIDWRAVAVGQGYILVAGTLLAVVAAFTLLKPTTPDTPAAHTLIVLAAFVVVTTAAVYVGQRLGVRTSLKILALTPLVVLMPLSIRSSLIGSFQNGDTPVEMLVYTQTSPDVRKVMAEVDRVGYRTGTGKNVKVVFDSGVSWPFEWYLRDYKGRVFIGQTNNIPADAPILLIGFENDHDAKLKPLLGNKYVGQRFRLRWWFPEELYREMTQGSFGQFLSDWRLRDQVWRFFFYRELPKPMGSTDFMMYVRRDLAGGSWTAQSVASEDAFASKTRAIAAVQIVGTAGAGPGQITEPKQLAIVPSGGLLVTDARNHRVVRLDQAGQIVASYGTRGDIPGQLNEPWSVAVAPDGSFYVADTWNHRIQKFSANGEVQAAWGGQSGRGQQLELFGPRSVAIEPAGTLIVTDTGNHRIIRLSADGRVLAQVGSRGIGNDQFNEPVGVAADRAGNVFVADAWNHRIVKMSPELRFLTSFPFAGWDSESVINKPYLATDAEGNVYATDPELHRAVKFSPTGQVIAVWGKPGNDDQSFRTPTGIAVDAAGNVWISDSQNNRLMRFPPVR